MRKLTFIMGLMFVGLLFVRVVLSAPLPAQGLNPYYTELYKDWLNETIDTRRSGALREGLNTSFYDLNITNSLIIIGNVNITLNLNVSGEIYLRGQSVQIESTSFKISNGTRLPFSNFGYSNITLFLGVQNESVIKVENRSWVLEMLGNSTINRSITNLNNLEYYEWRATAFNFANNLSALMDNTTIIRDTNLASKIQNSTINRSIDLSGYKTTDTNCSGLNSCINIFYSNNLTDVGSINRSVDLTPYNKSISLTDYLTTSFLPSFFNLANFTLAIGNRNASIPDLINNATFFNNFQQQTPAWNYANNQSIHNATITSALNSRLQNNSIARFTEINVTGQAGFNATIWLGNGSIQYNGSHICLGSC